MEFVTDALTLVVTRLEQFLYIFLARELDEIRLEVRTLPSYEFLGIAQRFGRTTVRSATSTHSAVLIRPLRLPLAEKQATCGQESRPFRGYFDA